jgi:hypothetical protein
VAATTFANPSDRRLKANVAPLDRRARHLFSLNGVSFNYKRRASDGAVSPDGLPDRNATHFGFIAQEVAVNFPELVGRGSDGMRSVQYSAFVPLLVESLKGQRAEFEQLRNAVEVLQGGGGSSGRSGRASPTTVSVKGLSGTGAVTAHHDLQRAHPSRGGAEGHAVDLDKEESGGPGEAASREDAATVSWEATAARGAPGEDLRAALAEAYEGIEALKLQVDVLRARDESRAIEVAELRVRDATRETQVAALEALIRRSLEAGQLRPAGNEKGQTGI